MAFIETKTDNVNNVIHEDCLQNEFLLRTILSNQQSIILDMQEKMEFIIPKMENEMIRFHTLNKLLLEKSAAQEMEIRKLKQKNYQTQKYAESNRNELLSKISIIETELQNLDSAYEVLKLRVDSNCKSFDSHKSISYRAFSERARI